MRASFLPRQPTTAQQHSYTWWGHSRRLRVTAQPSVTLRPHHVPHRCARARLLLLGPLVSGDVDAASFLRRASSPWSLLLSPTYVGILAQGFQRRLEPPPSGAVDAIQSPAPELLASLAPTATVFLSDVETVGWPLAVMQRVADASDRLLVTHGENGASEYLPGGAARHVAATPVAKVVDTNGAGDTFATAYMVARAAGRADPGAFASFAASRAVLQPQGCKPGCASDLTRGQLAGWTRRERALMAPRLWWRLLRRTTARWAAALSAVRQSTLT